MTLATLTVLATESGIPYDTALAKSAVPLGILIFLGGPYLLLRSNLGTRRAYLVLATSFFGFMLLLSLFWAFGGPGTPAQTGPTNLPGTVPDEYQPVWVPFAETSLVAERDPYAALVGDPAAFGPVPAAAEVNVASAVVDIQTFFSTERAGSRIPGTWAVAEGPFYAVADNGQPVIRVTFGATYQPDAQGQLPEGVTAGAVIPEGGEDAAFYTAYAFFDAGNPLFPSLVFIGLSLVGFALHGLLLHRDEQGERREAVEVSEERERVPAGA